MGWPPLRPQAVEAALHLLVERCGYQPLGGALAAAVDIKLRKPAELQAAITCLMQHALQAGLPSAARAASPAAHAAAASASASHPASPTALHGDSGHSSPGHLAPDQQAYQQPRGESADPYASWLRQGSRKARLPDSAASSKGSSPRPGPLDPPCCDAADSGSACSPSSSPRGSGGSSGAHELAACSSPAGQRAQPASPRPLLGAQEQACSEIQAYSSGGSSDVLVGLAGSEAYDMLHVAAPAPGSRPVVWQHSGREKPQLCELPEVPGSWLAEGSEGFLESICGHSSPPASLPGSSRPSSQPGSRLSTRPSSPKARPGSAAMRHEAASSASARSAGGSTSHGQLSARRALYPPAVSDGMHEGVRPGMPLEQQQQQQQQQLWHHQQLQLQDEVVVAQQLRGSALDPPSEWMLADPFSESGCGQPEAGSPGAQQPHLGWMLADPFSESGSGQLAGSQGALQQPLQLQITLQPERSLGYKGRAQPLAWQQAQGQPQPPLLDGSSGAGQAIWTDTDGSIVDFAAADRATAKAMQHASSVRLRGAPAPILQSEAGTAALPRRSSSRSQSSPGVPGAGQAVWTDTDGSMVDFSTADRDTAQALQRASVRLLGVPVPSLQPGVGAAAAASRRTSKSSPGVQAALPARAVQARAQLPVPPPRSPAPTRRAESAGRSPDMNAGLAIALRKPVPSPGAQRAVVGSSSPAAAATGKSTMMFDSPKRSYAARQPGSPAAAPASAGAAAASPGFLAATPKAGKLTARQLVYDGLPASTPDTEPPSPQRRLVLPPHALKRVGDPTPCDCCSLLAEDGSLADVSVHDDAPSPHPTRTAAMTRVAEAIIEACHRPMAPCGLQQEEAISWLFHLRLGLLPQELEAPLLLNPTRNGTLLAGGSEACTWR